MPRTRPGDILLDPEQFALALSRSVRVPVGTSRPPRVVVLREAGTRRWAAFKTLSRHPQLTPILKLAEALPRVGSFAITAFPPLWEES